MNLFNKLTTYGLLLASPIFASAQQRLLVGTYTNKGNSKGIYSYNYSAQDGSSTLENENPGIENPSYLCFSPNKKFVYAVNETGDNSTISAFSNSNGKLTLLNKRNSEGADPCYITTDGKNVLVANYSSGTISVFGINADGSLTAAKQVIKHTGKGTDTKGRQQSAHVHQVYFSPDRKFIISNDLGEDLTYVYAYNATAKTAILEAKNAYQSAPASGPRHLAFSPNGKFAYLAHEFTGVITAFTYKNGRLNKIQDIASVDQRFKGAIDGADIHVSPDGKFVYETNRGDANTINAFEILPTGRLKQVQSISTQGKGPRNFTFDPTGKRILVAHQYTNNVVVFNRDLNTGKLNDSGERIAVGTPVCLVFE